MYLSPTLKASDASRALRAVLEKRLGSANPKELSKAQHDAAQTVYRRLLLLVPEKNGGYAERSESWILANAPHITEADIAAVAWAGPFTSIEQAAERLADGVIEARKVAA